MTGVNIHFAMEPLELVFLALGLEIQKFHLSLESATLFSKRFVFLFLLL